MHGQDDEDNEYHSACEDDHEAKIRDIDDELIPIQKNQNDDSVDTVRCTAAMKML